MQLKLQLEGQVTELRSRVQELETALASARQEHAELMEQYKVGVGPGVGQGKGETLVGFKGGSSIKETGLRDNKWD